MIFIISMAASTNTMSYNCTTASNIQFEAAPNFLYILFLALLRWLESSLFGEKILGGQYGIRKYKDC